MLSVPSLRCSQRTCWTVINPEQTLWNLTQSITSFDSKLLKSIWKLLREATHIHLTVVLPSSTCLVSTIHPLDYNLFFFFWKKPYWDMEESWHLWVKNMVWNLGMISVLFQEQSSIRTEAFFYSNMVWYCCTSYCKKKRGTTSVSLVSSLCGRDLEKVLLYFRMQTEQ